MQTTFHHNGREYSVYDALMLDEIKAMMKMSDERDKNLRPLNPKSVNKYFEDTDKMAAALLRRCFRMTDDQISKMGQIERRNLASAFIMFLKTANAL